METVGAPVGILINIGLPIVGVATFLWFRKRFATDQILQGIYFLLFAHYGAVLVLLLTSLFWYWSGMASLGLFYLPTLGIVVMIAVGGLSYYRRKLSSHYQTAFVAAGLYILLMIMTVVSAVLWVKAL